MNIVDHSCQVAARLDNQGFESPLKHMAPFTPELVESIRENALQPLHTGREIGPGCLHRDMVVVWHDNVSMQLPVEPLGGLEKGFFKCSSSPMYSKQILAVISAIQDMVDSSRELNTRCAWHDRMKLGKD